MNVTAEIYLERGRWLLANAWRRRWFAFTVALIVAAASAVAVSLVHDKYRATARIYVDTQTVLKPMLAGLAYQADTDQQVNMLARTLISRPNVERLLQDPNIKLDEARHVPRDELVTKLMGQIKIDSAGAGNLYEISYSGRTPEQSLRVVDAIVSMFISTGASVKKGDSVEAGQFIERQIAEYEVKLTEAENRLKEFKLRNFGVSGVSTQDHFARISMLSDEVGRLRLELAAAERSRQAYRGELAAEDPQVPAPAEKVQTPPAVADVEARLETQRKHLDDLLRRFTERHPDVISSRRVIEQLESDLERQRAVAASRPSAERPGRAATSPVYQRIRVALAEAEARVAALHAQIAVQQAKLQEARVVASRAPQVETEFAQLNRDYDVMRKNYEQLAARRESAHLGVKLDEGSQLAEFRVIEPPRVSTSAIFPSRLEMALAAILISVVAGILATSVAERLSPRVHSLESLQWLSERRVIGSISSVMTPSMERGRRAAAVRFAAISGMAFLLLCAWALWIGLQSQLR